MSPLTRGFSAILTLFEVWRFREAHSVVNGAPLSEPAQKITAEAGDDVEKEGEIRIETQLAEPVVVHQEDEVFEWREVMRGVLDVQVWLTAFAYMGIIISLYSYSLFM